MSNNIPLPFSRNTHVVFACVLVLGLFAVFSAGSYLATRSYLIAELSWPVLVLVCLFAPSMSYPDSSDAYTKLCRVLVLIAFTYIFLQFPLYPVINAGLYTSNLTNVLGWALALILTALAWRTPIWLLASGFYLPWVKALAEHASGFLYDRLLDITPLFQMMMFCGVMALLFGCVKWLQQRTHFALWAKLNFFPVAHRQDRQDDSNSLVAFTCTVLVFVVMSFHFAGYLFSGVAKASLDGGFWYWPLVNNLQNIYLAGVINQQMPWVDIPHSVSMFTTLMDWIGRPMSLMVFFGQLAAVLAFSSKRSLIFLLLFYDVMHLGIFVSQGANFVTWALVNAAVIVALRAMPDKFFGLKPVLASIVLMVFVQFAYGKFYRVPNLGWYDSKAVNNGYFVADLKSGHSVRVPTAFFTFYSYPISHMSYGHPEGQYVPTDTNGGTKKSAINDKSERCDFSPEEMISTKREYWDAAAVTQFIQQYHLQMERWFADGAPLWLNVYWHHFWSPLSIHQEFKQVALTDVVSYTLIIESTCLSKQGSKPVGDIINTTQWKVPIERP